MFVWTIGIRNVPTSGVYSCSRWRELRRSHIRSIFNKFQNCGHRYEAGSGCSGFEWFPKFLPHALFTIYVMSDCRSAISKSRASTLSADGATGPWTILGEYFLTRKPGKGADGHRRQRTRLVPVYLQSQSHKLLAAGSAEIKLSAVCGNFRKFRCSLTLTLTLDRVEVILVRISGRGLPIHQVRSKSEKLFVDVRTDGRTHLSSNLLGNRLAMT